MKRERWNRLLAALDAASLDAVVLVPGPNLRYLTGGVFPFRERPTLVALKADGHIVVILPVLEETSWHKLSVEADVTLWVDSDGSTPPLRKVFGSGWEARRVGVEGKLMRAFEFVALQALMARCDGGRIERSGGLFRLLS